MHERPLTIGLSACVLHQDRTREVYNGRTLLYVEHSMARWLLESGQRVFVLPFVPGDPDIDATAHRLVEGIDALALHGGADVAPSTYGEVPRRAEWSGDALRDAYEIALVRASLERDIPVLGICRGHQVLNVALGGTLHQDIVDEIDGALEHTDRDLYAQNYHRVELLEGGVLADLYGATEGVINSVHHQSVKDLGEGLVITAESPEDGVIEGIWLERDSEDAPWAMGVQWHPEFQSDADTRALLPTAPLLEAFLNEAARRRR